MPAAPPHRALYQVDTRLWLTELGARLGRPATFADLSDPEIVRFGAKGFDWVWLLGAWETGEAGRQVSLARDDWRREYRELLPDYREGDVCGSPFAIREYRVRAEFGGEAALAALRARLGRQGMRLMLDFVPNHVALDHPWAREHPEWFVAGTEEDLERDPASYVRVETAGGPRVLALGRDPWFPAWPDALQLNYRHAGLRAAMLGVLENVAQHCDGVRCDMAMLLLPEVIARSWGDRARPSDGSEPVDESFWPGAIERVHRRFPGFTFMAEVYWDLEWELQQQGFDYTYDKRLYDRLRALDAPAVRSHLLADAEFQRRSARFTENHDEPRAVEAFPPPIAQAAAVVSLLAPGLAFVHEGQLSGRRIRVSNHLSRRALERPDPDLELFHERLLACLRRDEVREGEWRLLEVDPAWDGNSTWDRFIAFEWSRGAHRLLVAVNYGASQSQCFVKLPHLEMGAWLLDDLLDPPLEYLREGHDLASRGLYLDLPPWGAHVFEMSRA
jgi:hypothetical protein